MLRVCLTLAATCLCFAPVVRAQELVSNGDFEHVGLEADLGGWVIPPACVEGGFRAEISADDPVAGEQCGRVWYAGKDEPQSFGNLVQSLSAEGYRGKRVRLRASVRVQGASHAQLWLRTDGARDFSVLLDNMYDRPIDSEDWSVHDIKAEIDPRADRLVFGMMLFGSGEAFVDDFSITVLGDAGAGNEPARPLTEREKTNLIAFTRVLGYVRHFHPSDQAAVADWDWAAIAGVRAVAGAVDERDLAAKLQAFFAPFAPTLQVFLEAEPPPPCPELQKPRGDAALRLVRWRNVGFAASTGRGSIYSRSRARSRLKDGAPREDWSHPSETYAVELVPGVQCRLPVVLFGNADGTLPHAAEDAAGLPLPPEDFIASGDDRSTRLAAVALAWNVFQHFYPYFDVVDVDWPGELERALTRAAKDANARAFLDTLRRMVAALRDGHGGVHHASDTDFAAPPIECAWVGHDLVVTRSPEGSELRAGDVVVALDGVVVRERLAAIEPLISAATPQFLRHVASRGLLLGSAGSTLVLEVVSPGGVRRKVELARQFGGESKPRLEKLAEVEPGVYYVDLDRITEEEFEQAVPALAEAKGIVFDLRGYPQLSTAPLSHLIDQPIESPQWLIPLVHLPDGAETKFAKSSWRVAPRAPRFGAKIAFITDGRAISYAETTLGLVAHHQLALIVGETTAGTNGNVNPFELPGGYSVSWTGMKVLKQDGARHHGVGIAPTVPCSRTIAGIAADRDEQLERALALVRE